MAIRDADRFKDKVEVSLDNRQIFFLFFGGAVLACLVFVLGVMVGRRMEGRERVAHRAQTSAAVDPLAALDDLNPGGDEPAEGEADLAFPLALAGPPGQKGKPLGAADTAPAPPPAKPAAAPIGGPKMVTAALGGALGKKPAAAPAPAPAPALAAEIAAVPAPEAEGKKKKRFTLQISSFQDKGQAETLASKLSTAGYAPYVVTSDVPEKGTFYRVRLGEYADRETALAAKGDFEKKQHAIAYVTKLSP